MNNPNHPCIFCKINQKELIFENDYAYASSDSYPVSKLHSLVVPKRCIENYFELGEKYSLFLKHRIFEVQVSKIFPL